MASLVEFLTSGKLGEIEIGLRPEQVIKVLGAPDDQSTRRQPLHLLRYGAVEFAFLQVRGCDESRLVSTAVHYDRPDHELPPSLRTVDWSPTNEITEDQFREFVNLARLPAHLKVQGQQEYLIFPSGASAAFVDGRLHSIHHKRAEKQQVPARPVGQQPNGNDTAVSGSRD